MLYYTHSNECVKYFMHFVIHNQLELSSKFDPFGQYRTPIWEIEVQSDLLSDPAFESALRCDDNFVVSQAHHNVLRSGFNGTGIVSDFLAHSQKDFLLDLVSQSSAFKPRYYKTIDRYKQCAQWFATVYRDQPGFSMAPHLDNNHVMVQMVVNLLQDNKTATEFYHVGESRPCYRAPLARNHGVVFLNTPGAVHSIANVTHSRWILYGGLTL